MLPAGEGRAGFAYGPTFGVDNKLERCSASCLLSGLAGIGVHMRRERLVATVDTTILFLS